MGKTIEFIDREKARETVCSLCRWEGTSNCEECEHPIDDIPAADVRPVVFCRDCKYNRGTKTWIDNDVTADCTNGHGYPPLDWFCADGEKREES